MSRLTKTTTYLPSMSNQMSSSKLTNYNLSILFEFLLTIYYKNPSVQNLDHGFTMKFDLFI